MRIRDLLESSGLTFKGSITPDLMESKIWLCRVLKELDLEEFSSIYILGSWYGNMAYVLSRMDIPFDKIINVDVNKKSLELSNKILNAAKLSNFESMHEDANKLDYRQLGDHGLVINTSIQDIKGQGWWEHIPPGTTVALQDRDNTKLSRHKTLNDFNNDYPVNKSLFLDSIDLEDPETEYQRFMKIGIK